MAKWQRKSKKAEAAAHGPASDGEDLRTADAPAGARDERGTEGSRGKRRSDRREAAAAADGADGPVGVEQVRQAQRLLQTYKQGKAALERRIIENDQWYKLHSRTGEQDGQLRSAWLFNSIANKHADAMDNFPEPVVLPREESDKQAAQALTSILPVILEQNGFEQVYADLWWYKLKTGASVCGVFWDPRKNGVGDVEIRCVDLLNLFWEPGVRDIQRSRNLFHVELWDNEVLRAQYPQLANLSGGWNNGLIARYLYDDSIDLSDKSAVVDWYYKRPAAGGGDVLHYCKFCGEQVLYASENDPAYARRGFYDHGQYPFIFDVLFVEEGTPTGFGYIDVMRDTQIAIDRLNNALVRNALMASKPRFFIRADGGVNEQEFADWSRDFVHVESAGLGEDCIRQIQFHPMSDAAVSMLVQKIDELKETSGNRDFSQGGTSGGVTAASAIAALQEAGSKLSRDMIGASYRAFTAVNYLVIELIRQFYDAPRCFRITGGQGERFVRFDNAPLQPRPLGGDFGLALGAHEPVFDIRIVPQKNSPFSRLAQNEMALNFFRLGLFRPDVAEQARACVEMMNFEGKDTVLRQIDANARMRQTIEQMGGQLEKMAAVIDAQNGTALKPVAAAQAGDAV